MYPDYKLTKGVNFMLVIVGDLYQNNHKREVSSSDWQSEFETWGKYFQLFFKKISTVLTLNSLDFDYKVSNKLQCNTFLVHAFQLINFLGIKDIKITFNVARKYSASREILGMASIC